MLRSFAIAATRRPQTTALYVRAPMRAMASSALRNTDLFREQTYIGGQWQDAPDKKTFSVTNLADNSILGTCPDVDEHGTHKAIEIAHRTFQSFRHTRPQDRALLRRWHALVQKNIEPFSRILMLENGRPTTGAKQEIQYSASFIDWFAGEAIRSYGYTTQGTVPGHRVVTIKQSVGVVGY